MLLLNIFPEPMIISVLEFLSGKNKMKKEKINETNRRKAKLMEDNEKGFCNEPSLFPL